VNKNNVVCLDALGRHPIKYQLQIVAGLEGFFVEIVAAKGDGGGEPEVERVSCQ